MKSFLICLSFFLFSALTLAQEKTYGESDTTIALTEGEIFSIKVASNRTTGYSWSVGEVSDAGQVAILSSEYISTKSGRDGEGGDELWRFKALRKGAVKLIWNYTRPWENEPAVKTIIFSITVN